MCGVAGIVGRISDANRAALACMIRAMKHRGPDGSGVWESPSDARGSGVMLGHTRLSILDLSTAASQPMVDPVTGHVLVYNGEIYNYVSLRDRLVETGQTFESTGDTAVLLRALAIHGADAVPWLRGMFAFAVWDPAARKLVLARDPLGIKPLYVARRVDGDQWSLAFASELRALLASGLLGKPSLDSAAAASVVWNGFVVGPTTAVSGVESLDPGQIKVFDAAGREEAATHYWSMQRRADFEEMDETTLARELQDCVHLHLASDVPLGVFLSGGIDSSAVANLAQKVARSPIHTFTLSFEEREFDEGPHAKRIAQAIGTDHHEVVLSQDRFVTNLEAALDSLDQPTFDGLNAYYMSRAVRDAGFTVALVGTGGDELFGGYTTFRDLPPMLRWVRRAKPLPRAPLVAAAGIVASALAGTGQGFPPQTRWAKLPEMIRHGDDLLSLYQLAYALFLPDAQRELLGADANSLREGVPASLRRGLEREIEGRSALSAISVLEERLFLGERLLPDNDAASMAASIEQRLPLVDHVLFGHVDRLPDRARYVPVRQKSILRRIGLRGLQPELFDRPKSGFMLPFERWIRKGLHRSIDQTLRDPAAVRAAGLAPEPVERLWRAFLDGAPGVYWSRVWALFVLIRWCQKQGIRR